MTIPLAHAKIFHISFCIVRNLRYRNVVCSVSTRIGQGHMFNLFNLIADFVCGSIQSRSHSYLWFVIFLSKSLHMAFVDTEMMLLEEHLEYHRQI